MAKPNYAFEKRQKELAKKQKKQEKLQQRKASDSHETDPESAAEVSLDDATALPAAPESN
ncbi:MAG: hypothetical protein Q8O79_04545 [Pseudomonadota bacterium]|nr:hypothetical protein [Pseudomonadota bacterium]